MLNPRLLSLKGELPLGYHANGGTVVFIIEQLHLFFIVSYMYKICCRLPLYLGMVGVGLNVLIFFYSSMSVWGVRRFDEKWELTSISALPFVTLLGLISFCL